MKKPRITHAPDVIFLQVGDIGEDADFRELATEEITWCEDRMFDSDLEYRLVKRRKRTADRTTDSAAAGKGKK